MNTHKNKSETRPRIAALDHLVLTVRDIERTIGFYMGILGMTAETFYPADGSERVALKFGSQKINLHPAGAEFAPNAATATPGSADLCFIAAGSLTDWLAHLEKLGVKVLAGPVERTGARGMINSIYLRDPDGNLIEIAEYR